MPIGDTREFSRREWSTANTLDSVNAGSLQRIADATENMAAGWIALTADRDRYKSSYEDERDHYRAYRKKADAQIRALKGVIAKMKKQREAPHA